MSDPTKQVKEIIREEIWNSLIKFSGVENYDNPYALEEMLHGCQDLLNESTEKTFNKLKEAGVLFL